MDIRIDYHPQEKQRILHECPANEILFGGAAGGSKSHAIRFEGLIWCLRVPGLQAFLFRRTSPDLDRNHVYPSLEQFPTEAGSYRAQKNVWFFRNGSALHFCHCQYEKDVFHYQGAEINLLLVDELTTFTEFIYDYLRARVRCAIPIPEKYRHKIPGIVSGSNPGGVGHGFVKRRWVDFCEPYELKRAPRSEGGMMRCFIPSKLEDNPILQKNDPGYIHRLDALPEPYRSAYKDGDWDIFIGQAFNFNRKHHVIKPLPVPRYATLYMTFDWGFAAPFSVGWWFVDGDGRIYRFAEWYGWNGTPNQGLRLTDDQIVEGIIEREKKLNIWDRNEDIYRYGGPDCFSKKPDYKGGGQGPSTSEVFAGHDIILSPGDPDRSKKIRQFHARLRVVDDQMPMMVVYEGCQQFIRTISDLQTNPNNVEDVDTNLEDHIYDEACHILMARPIAVDEPVKPSQEPEIDPMSDVRKFYTTDPEPESNYIPLDQEAGY